MDRPKLRLTTICTLAGLAAAACGAAQPATGHSHPIHSSPATARSHQAASNPTTTAPAPTSTSATPAATPPPAPPVASAAGVNTADPNAVADAMLEATFTVNTAVDVNPFAAVKRSLVWYTPEEANKVLASAPTGSPGAQWTLWAKHQVTTTVTVSPPQGGGPPDQPTLVYRAYIVTQTPTGTGGWTAPPNKYICYVILARNGTGPWQIANLQVDPYGNGSASTGDGP